MDCLADRFFRISLALLAVVLVIYSPQSFAQDTKKEADKTEATEESSETPEDGETPSVEGGENEADAGEKEPEKEKTREELREEMMEKLADNLSLRARMLSKRETSLIDREQELLEREIAISEREKALADLELLLESREKIVRRRENLPPPQAWSGPEAPSVLGRHAAVIDGQTMQFYYKKSADYKIPVASTQKLMTALLVCQAGSLDTELVVPKEVYDVEPTVVGVKPGEVYTRREILTGLLVRSGNDLAATLAIDNAGSVEAFAEKMNTLAKALGMMDSNFVNPHGLPAKGQYSTAHDMALAAFEAYQVPEIREIVKKKTYEFHLKSGKIYKLYNTNKVLSSLPSCNGMKTGFTYAAGNCLISSASDNGQDRITVMLKSSRPNVYTDSQKLLEWSLALKLEGPITDDEEKDETGALIENDQPGDSVAMIKG